MFNTAYRKNQCDSTKKTQESEGSRMEECFCARSPSSKFWLSLNKVRFYRKRMKFALNQTRTTQNSFFRN